ncbi:hypothetical protein PRK78_001838 [Emydomyces testavorans]|uniref:Autophagy-related protein 33 n=1 Tax=Emydomyces testavorans TaxID=2070801 RepID=A0AAF0IFW7_9EURO|nr:hypothetical protein PRK78_001838 [Emydomyces testavorans]
MACPITVAKFVGTISLGLLTGLSYSTYAISIPSLQLLPTANSAAQPLKEIQLRTRRRVLTLSNLTIISFITAFTLSSPRRRHPYLIWTSLTALIAGLGLECWFNRKDVSWGYPCMASLCCGRSSASSPSSSWSPCTLDCSSWIATHLGYRRNQNQTDRRQEEEESNGNGSEIEILEEAEAMPTPTTGDQSVAPAEPAVDVNGESVKEDMERERRLQKMRTWILGVGFSMGVVGIWGDGA